MDLKKVLERLFATERLAVLATGGDSGPYTSLMSVVVTPDLAQIFFVTDRSSRKYIISLKIPRSPFFSTTGARAVETPSADDRRNSPRPGAEQVMEQEKAAFLETFLAVHPHLDSVVRSPSTILVVAAVSSYLVVRGFDDVRELILQE